MWLSFIELIEFGKLIELIEFQKKRIVFLFCFYLYDIRFTKMV